MIDEEEKEGEGKMSDVLIAGSEYASINSEDHSPTKMKQV